MKKHVITMWVYVLTLGILCGCNKSDDTSTPVVIPPKNEVEGEWQHIRTGFIENIKGQTVNVDKLTIDYRFEHTKFTETQTYEGRLASNNATSISQVIKKTATYELLQGYIKSTITDYEIDGEDVTGLDGRPRYYFYRLTGTGHMQLGEAQSSVRLSGAEGNLDNSSFYFYDSTYTTEGYYSYRHINLLFSNSSIYEYIQFTTSRTMPSWNAGSFFTCPVQIYSNYFIRVEEPPVHVPYMFINGVLFKSKPLDAPENLFTKKG